MLTAQLRLECLVGYGWDVSIDNIVTGLTRGAWIKGLQIPIKSLAGATPCAVPKTSHSLLKGRGTFWCPGATCQMKEASAPLALHSVCCEGLQRGSGTWGSSGSCKLRFALSLPWPGSPHQWHTCPQCPGDALASPSMLYWIRLWILPLLLRVWKDF